MRENPLIKPGKLFKLPEPPLFPNLSFDVLQSKAEALAEGYSIIQSIQLCLNTRYYPPDFAVVIHCYLANIGWH
jgi:hypothetical protein